MSNISDNKKLIKILLYNHNIRNNSNLLSGCIHLKTQKASVTQLNPDNKILSHLTE